MRVGIIGGGVLGLSLAYFLSRRGADAVVFEGRTRAGGLLDCLEVDGTWIDKYYHCILSSDTDLLSLIEEIGLRDRIRFGETGQGVYRGGQLYPLTSGRDFLTFPPLTLLERLRLGLTVLSALRISDYQEVEKVGVEEWLVRLGGRGAFEKIWKPLLRAKFDGSFGSTPATYIWSRLKRISSTRTAAGQKELMGYLVGSYKVFVDRLVERIRASGSEVRLGAEVQQLAVREGRATGVIVEGEVVPLDAVVVTTPLPILYGLVPEAYRPMLDLPADSEYLGVVCGLMLTDRPLTRYYTLNITDEHIPFTGIIEATNLVNPAHVGGHHLVYLPKYVTPNSAFLRYSDSELRSLYLDHLGRMFPRFDTASVKGVFVFRERFVEPLHLIGRRRPVLPITTELPGLFIVNNGQIYPELTNCQASVRHARSSAQVVLRNARTLAHDPGSSLADDPDADRGEWERSTCGVSVGGGGVQ